MKYVPVARLYTDKRLIIFQLLDLVVLLGRTLRINQKGCHLTLHESFNFQTSFPVLLYLAVVCLRMIRMHVEKICSPVFEEFIKEFVTNQQYISQLHVLQEYLKWDLIF